MHEHHRWAWFAVLGFGYALFGAALTVQEVMGGLAVRWDVLIPILVIGVGLLLTGSAVLSGRR